MRGGDLLRFGLLRLGPVVVYLGNKGARSIRWAVQIRTPAGYVCARPPIPWLGLRGYAYVSRNATPWGAWWAVGDVSREDRERAAMRRRLAWAWTNPDQTEDVDEQIWLARGAS